VAGLVGRGQLLCDTPSVQCGQHDVEQDEIRPLRAGERKRRCPVRGLDRVEPGRAEVDAADEPDRLLVVDDQDLAERTGVAALALCGAAALRMRLSVWARLVVPAASSVGQVGVPACSVTEAGAAALRPTNGNAINAEQAN
jgi:hypothetical protein